MDWLLEVWREDPVGAIIYGTGAVVVIGYTVLYWGRILYLSLRGQNPDD
jgi:hypothetical protein